MTEPRPPMRLMPQIPNLRLTVLVTPDQEFVFGTMKKSTKGDLAYQVRKARGRLASG